MRLSFYQQDKWTYWHRYCCFVGTALIWWGLHIPLLFAALVMLALGFVWEYAGDELLGKQLGVKYFDSRGADWQDILSDTEGILMAVGWLSLAGLA